MRAQKKRTCKHDRGNGKAGQKRRLWRDRQDRRPRAAPRAARAHALFQPFNIPSGSMSRPCWSATTSSSPNTPTATRAIRCPFSPAPLRRAASSARDPKRGDVVVFKLPQRQLDRLHQARDRPAGRPHPGEARRALHQRRAGAARARSATTSPSRRLGADRACHATARRCRTASAT